MASLKFTLNHMVAPNLDVMALMDMANRLEIGSIEVRNDLGSDLIASVMKPTLLAEHASSRGLTIASINALQRFNDWSETRRNEAADLIQYAVEADIPSLVLVPVNDGSGHSSELASEKLKKSISELAPLLDKSGIVGLIEPLCFESCSLRSKKVARDMILELGLQQHFKLVHDTFHHTLAKDDSLHADMTGLIHISGVVDANTALNQLTDNHRGLVDKADLLGNVSQIKMLMQDGYIGTLSFEPFARIGNSLNEIEENIRQSMNYIRLSI